ncbi:hypothetical protein LZ31DRAFT_28211 [Colletotrichum somersetense]|nr:hypothetical protein LZ31DRAFT_28211 [Colletotrichum somersetense]
MAQVKLFSATGLVTPTTWCYAMRCKPMPLYDTSTLLIGEAATSVGLPIASLHQCSIVKTITVQSVIPTRENHLPAKESPLENRATSADPRDPVADADMTHEGTGVAPVFGGCVPPGHRCSLCLRSIIYPAVSLLAMQ